MGITQNPSIKDGQNYCVCMYTNFYSHDPTPLFIGQVISTPNRKVKTRLLVVINSDIGYNVEH